MNVEVKRDGLTLRGELVVPEKIVMTLLFSCTDLPETATENY